MSREIIRPDTPTHIGPAEFSTLRAMVVVRCPSELTPLMRKAGAVGTGIVALGDSARNLRLSTDPLFRRAGIDWTGENYERQSLNTVGAPGGGPWKLPEMRAVVPCDDYPSTGSP
jgi:hypothetical protein